jgi:outer membrane protein TolC
MAQSLGGMVTIPLLRHEAIEAAISQADANLRASKAARKQMESDVGGRLSIDLLTLRDAQRQLNLLENSIAPRAARSVELARGEYETGRATLVDLLNQQRALIDLKRLAAHLHATTAQQSADIEAIVGRPL